MGSGGGKATWPPSNRNDDDDDEEEEEKGQVYEKAENYPDGIECTSWQ